MDKRKLVSIINKDLEEIKNLTEEVADSQEDTSLVIELALNRARLLVQEIELLRELAGNSVPLPIETDEDCFDEDDEEVSNISFPDPELEILHFEEQDFPEAEELSEDDDEGIIEEDFEQENKEEEELEPEEEEEEELIEEEEDDLEEEGIENIDEELDEDDLTEEEEIGEDDIEEDELEEAPEFEDDDEEDEEPLQKPNIQQTELKYDPQPGVREIHIDDLDDDDEPVRFSPTQGSSVKPPMHEIQKPENTVPEKAVIGETFHKERSLNDSIGENKSESKLTNSPITSLRAAIGLNDRFIFIREIFDNNSEKYNTIIENLDKMEHIQEAVEFLKANLSMQKNEASMKFVELLKRRFTS